MNKMLNRNTVKKVNGQSQDCCKTTSDNSTNTEASAVFLKFTRVFGVTNKNTGATEVKENPARINAVAIMGYYPRKKYAGSLNYLRLITGEEVDVKETTAEIERKLKQAGVKIID